PVRLLGGIRASARYFVGFPLERGVLVVLGVAAYGTLGNFAAFFEVAAATRLDGSGNRVRLLPFLVFGFLVSLVSVSKAAVVQVLQSFAGEEHHWQKTERYRPEANPGTRAP